MCCKYYRFSSKESAKLFLDDGLIYFNSLNYYRNYPEENNAIKDLKEGSIECNIPSNNIEITYDGHTIKNEEIASKNVVIRNGLKEPENFFIFCLSNKYSEIMYNKFNADACVEIKDIGELFSRIQNTLPQNHKLYFDDVEYYDTKTFIKNNKPLCLYKAKNMNIKPKVVSTFMCHI